MPTEATELDGWFVGNPIKELKAEKRKQILAGTTTTTTTTTTTSPGENTKKRKRNEDNPVDLHPNITVAKQLTELSMHRFVVFITT